MHDPNRYESLGQGHCSANTVATFGRIEVEFCYYDEGARGWVWVVE